MDELFKLESLKFAYGSDSVKVACGEMHELLLNNCIE